MSALHDLTAPARRVRWLPVAAATLALAMVAGCAPLLVGGAVMGTGLLVTDRRSAGTQLDDSTIESKGEARAKALATLGRINISSYNRMVLITGEVPAEEYRGAVEKAVAGIDNVRTVFNELAVGTNASTSQRASDSVLEAKVKASFVDDKTLHANAFRVIAERGNIYLMGRVTEREGTRAAEVARTVPGVVKVVRVFEILTEDELKALSTGK